MGQKNKTPDISDHHDDVTVFGSGNRRAVLADHGEVGRGHNGRSRAEVPVRHRNIGPVYTAGSGIVDFGGDETLFVCTNERALCK